MSMEIYAFQSRKHNSSIYIIMGPFDLGVLVQQVH